MRVYLAGPLFTPYERGFLDECAARLRADGFEVFVPHEQALATEGLSADEIFRRDAAAIERADAMLALLDGAATDDGTACEIGLFHALRRGPVVGLLTDFRGRVNLFVQGCVEANGKICGSLDDAVEALERWRSS